MKYMGIMTNLNLWNPWGYVTDMSICHGAGVWSMDYVYVKKKTVSTFAGLFQSPAGSRRAARGARICEARLLDKTAFV